MINAWKDAKEKFTAAYDKKVEERKTERANAQTGHNEPLVKKGNDEGSKNKPGYGTGGK